MTEEEERAQERRTMVKVPDEDCFNGIEYLVWLDVPDDEGYSPFSANTLEDARMLAEGLSKRTRDEADQ